MTACCRELVFEPEASAKLDGLTLEAKIIVRQLALKLSQTYENGAVLLVGAGFQLIDEVVEGKARFLGAITSTELRIRAFHYFSPSDPNSPSPSYTGPSGNLRHLFAVCAEHGVSFYEAGRYDRVAVVPMVGTVEIFVATPQEQLRLAVRDVVWLVSASVLNNLHLGKSDSADGSVSDPLEAEDLIDENLRSPTCFDQSQFSHETSRDLLTHNGSVNRIERRKSVLSTSAIVGLLKRKFECTSASAIAAAVPIASSGTDSSLAWPVRSVDVDLKMLSSEFAEAEHGNCDNIELSSANPSTKIKVANSSNFDEQK